MNQYVSCLNLYRTEKDRIRENLNPYTRKAFELLPKLNNPHILDVGCGTGVPTIELAKLSGGSITGLDSDITSLNVFREKLHTKGFDHHVRIMEQSILTMDFPEVYFDIIWAEGSLYVLGFTESIMNWRRFLKPDGFLVIHDENRDKTEKIESLSTCGYQLISQFDLTDSVWRHEYFIPLEQLIHEFRFKYPADSELIHELNKDQKEIDQSKTNSITISSFFCIMQKAHWTS